jgi:hypothetical protein
MDVHRSDGTTVISLNERELVALKAICKAHALYIDVEKEDEFTHKARKSIVSRNSRILSGNTATITIVSCVISEI